MKQPEEKGFHVYCKMVKKGAKLPVALGAAFAAVALEERLRCRKIALDVAIGLKPGKRNGKQNILLGAHDLACTEIASRIDALNRI